MAIATIEQLQIVYYLSLYLYTCGYSYAAVVAKYIGQCTLFQGLMMYVYTALHAIHWTIRLVNNQISLTTVYFIVLTVIIVCTFVRFFYLCQTDVHVKGVQTLICLYNIHIIDK